MGLKKFNLSKTAIIKILETFFYHSLKIVLKLISLILMKYIQVIH